MPAGDIIRVRVVPLCRIPDERGTIFDRAVATEVLPQRFVRQRQVGWFHQFGLGGAQSGRGKMASTVRRVGLEHRIWMAL